MKSVYNKKFTISFSEVIRPFITLYRYLRFINERSFYSFIVLSQLKLDYIPLVIGLSRNSIQLEMIRLAEHGDDILVAKKLFEFQKLHIKYTLTQKIITLFGSPIIGLFRLSIQSMTIGLLPISLSFLKIIINDSLSIRAKFNKINLHKDFRDKENILWESSDRVVFIDFESLTTTTKWVLNDIIDFSFDPIQKSLKYYLIKNFWTNYYPSISYKELKSHIRTSVLRKSIAYLIYNWESRINRTEQQNFILSILNEDSYENWLKINEQ